VSSIYEADAIIIHSFGVVQNGRSFINAIRASDLRYERTEIEIFRAIRFGTTGIVVSGAAVTNGVFFGERRMLDDLFVMVWSREREGWKLISFQSTPADSDEIETSGHAILPIGLRVVI
jgi:hypothetical protein